MTLLDFLHVIDSSENITVFINDDFFCEVNSLRAMDLLAEYHEFEVQSIETNYTKTRGDEPIIHLCVYLKPPRD